MNELRVFSFGGGVQSTAALVLAARGEIPYRIFAFANVGEDSEHPATLRYVREVAMPYAEKHGIELVELVKTRRDGSVETLVSRIDNHKSSNVIPIRAGNGAPGNRTCTVDFKIRVVDRFLKSRGATKTSPAIIGLGISVDEYQRMRTDSGQAFKTLDYPLIDKRISRMDCVNIIQSENLPVPPKSSCFFCPFHAPAVWRKMRRDEPELFQASVALERKLNDRRDAQGKYRVYLTRFGKPLDEAIGDAMQPDLFGEDEDSGGCDIAGYCMV